MDDAPLTEALARRLYRRADVSGRIVLPAVPGLIDEYVSMCDTIFVGIGVRFSDEQIDALRGVIAGQLAEAYTTSPRSEIVITYECPQGLVVNYRVHAHWATVESAYDNWIATRQAPYFGSEPDARVLSLSVEAPDPTACPVLDIGAGTGRNALTLARRGHPVDAVEMAPKFAESLREASASESLPVRVIESDIFAAGDALRRDYGLIVVSEVTSDFRTVDQLRKVFEVAAEVLAPGGHLVLNAFLAKGDYTPDTAAIQLGQQCYTSMFTREQVAAATADLPLSLESDESVFDYEKAHLPAIAWPPTSWYEGWVSGQDVFDLPRAEVPIELRWLVYRKPA